MTEGMMARTAQCSCGALRLEVSGEPDAVVACHCGECQRRTGSVLGVGAYFKKEHVSSEGPDKIYVRDGQEGRKLRNHFCPTCGTTVFWEADLRPELIGVAVGAFGESDFPRPTRSVWEESKHEWVAFAHELVRFPQGRPA
jgi:hypothetical protein